MFHFEKFSEFEYGLMDLAASKIIIAEKIAPKFHEFRHNITTTYRDKIIELKDCAFRHNIPSKHEIKELN